MLGQSSHEVIKVISAVPPQSVASATALYNGLALASVANNPIDTKGFEEALVIINAGTMGVDTVTFELFTATDAAGTVLVAVSDAGGNATKAVANADDNKTFLLRYRCVDKKRFLFVKSTAAGANANVYGVNVLLTKAKETPVTQTQTVAFVDNT